jgi:hypothetical protein
MPNLQNSIEEIWVPVTGFEEVYRVSNFGEIKSINRKIYRKICKGFILQKGIILKQSKNADGYPTVTLYKDCGKRKMPMQVYLIVFWSFNKNVQKLKGFEVDHIDNDKMNSALSNLQYIKSRYNSSKRSINHKKSSIFTGVSWAKEKRKWQAHIRIKGKSTYLGRYENEIDAAIAYQNALKKAG